jgi:hypothetical protein
MEKDVVENIKYDPLSIASVGMAFTQYSKQNPMSTMYEIEDYKEKLRFLEEEM